MSNPKKIERLTVIKREMKDIRQVIDMAGGKAKAITLPKEFLDEVGQNFEKVETWIMQMQGKFVLLVIPILEKQEKKEKEEER